MVQTDIIHDEPVLDFTHTDYGVESFAYDVDEAYTITYPSAWVGDDYYPGGWVLKTPRLRTGGPEMVLGYARWGGFRFGVKKTPKTAQDRTPYRAVPFTQAVLGTIAPASSEGVSEDRVCSA
jgi:hypothetical protein